MSHYLAPIIIFVGLFFGLGALVMWGVSFIPPVFHSDGYRR